MADIQEIYAILLGQSYQEKLFQDLTEAKKEGKNIRTSCPFCSSSSGFSYNLEKPIWHCWSCDKGGDWIEYLKEREVLDFHQAALKLAQAAGVELDGFSEEARQAYKDKQRTSEILSVAISYMQETLEAITGQQDLAYLEERGYTLDQIKDMELGSYFNRHALIQHLEKLGYSQTEIQKAGLLTQGLGETHTLALLWRDASGHAIGLACRTIQPDQEPKYKYSYGLKKSQGLVGLEASRGSDQVVLVEGVMDALLLARAYKVPAVATGGTSISAEQMKALEWSGAREVLLAFDMDEAGRRATAKAIWQLRRSSKLRPYVLSWQGAKDPDELVRKDGLEAFQEAMRKAERWPSWLARYIVAKYDISTDRGMDQALDEAFRIQDIIEDGLDQRAFSQTLEQSTGIEPEVIARKLQEHSEQLQAEQKSKVLQDLTRKLEEKASQSDILGAEVALTDALKDLRTSRGVVAPDPYLQDDLIEDVMATAPGLKTGYQKLDEILTLPRGAISIVAGRPAHGKTTIQLNLLTSFLDRYPDKAFYFFSYEEARKFLALKLLMIKSGEMLSERFNQEAYIHYLKEKRGSNKKIEQALEWYGQATSSGRLIISDQMLGVEDLSATIEYVCQRHEVGAILVDYIQKIPIARPSSQRYLDIKAISQSLLEQAVSQDVPVILGAQLGRGSKGEGKEPSLSDLREAGDIEQDANVVLSVYNASAASTEEGQADLAKKVDLVIKILKQRGGLAGQRVSLEFDRPVLKIEDTSPMRPY